MEYLPTPKDPFVCPKKRIGPPTFLFFSDGIGTRKILFDREGSGDDPPSNLFNQDTVSTKPRTPTLIGGEWKVEAWYLDVTLEVNNSLGSVGYNPNISHL